MHLMLTTRSFTTYVMALALGILPASIASSEPLAQYGRSSSSLDIGVFYDDLDPYGDWIDYEDYGYVFAPRVGPTWRPYTQGHWAMTQEYGYLWVSQEPFGWATYHYGRWMPSRYGWLWVPGYDWGPAWVSWRSGGDYVGWAPLPPQARWQVGVGFNIGGAHFDAFIGDRDYNFVPYNRFADYRYNRVADYVVPVEQNVTIINVTQNVTNYVTTGERHVVNRGIDPQQVRQRTGREVRTARVRAVSDVGEARQARASADEVPVLVAEVKKDDRKPKRAIARTEIQRAPALQERARRTEERERQIEAREEEVVKKNPEVAAKRQQRQREREQAQREVGQTRPDETRQTERQRDADQQRERQPSEQRQRDEQQQAGERQQNDQRQQTEQRQREEQQQARERQQDQQRQRAEQQQQQQQQQARERQQDQQQQQQARERQDQQQRDKQKAEQDKKAAEKKKQDEKKKKQDPKEKDKPADEEPPRRR